MTVPASTLEMLGALARESASGRRLQLLHDITDPLFAPGADTPESRPFGAEAPAETSGAEGERAESLDATEFARRARLRRQLDFSLLFRLIRDGEDARARVCFAELAGIDTAAAHGAFADPSHELLAMVCKAQAVPRAVFAMIAVLREGKPAATAVRIGQLAAIFDRTPQDAAERALRFWRLRKHALPGAPPPPSEITII